MPTKEKSLLGRDLLRRGSRGPAVTELQRRLAALGYDPGPADGLFGPRTEDALYQLQEDYHLRRDGIAGRQVAALLAAGAPPLHVAHTVLSGEDPYALAERYGVSPALLRRLAAEGTPYRRRRLVPGTRLNIPVRPVLAEAGEGGPEDLERLQRVLLRHRGQVTALVAPWMTVRLDGLLEGRIDQTLWEAVRQMKLPVIARVRIAAPDGLPPTRRQCRRALEEAAFTAERYRLPGLYVAFDRLAPGETYAAAALVSGLRRLLRPPAGLYLETPASAAATGQCVADLAPVDRVVLRLADAPSEEDRPLVRRFLGRHPSYQVFLGLSATGFPEALQARLALVPGLALGGAALWDLAGAQQAVFRAVADLFSVQRSEAWVDGRRNIHEPGA